MSDSEGITVTEVPQKPKEPIKIKALGVMSMPNLTHTENAFCVQQGFGTLRIPITKCTAVFRHSALEGLIEDAITGGFEYVVTVDYDTVFIYQQLLELFRLILDRPEAVGIWPVQLRRENPEALVSVFPTGHPHRMNPDEGRESMKNDEVLRARSGHFGLTVLRLNKVKQLKKPWFMAYPDKNDRWRENSRQDADITFWRRCEEKGFPAYQANRIRIGHIQRVISWIDSENRCAFQYVTDWQLKGSPPGISLCPEAPGIKHVPVPDPNLGIGMGSVEEMLEEKNRAEAAAKAAAGAV